VGTQLVLDERYFLLGQFAIKKKEVKWNCLQSEYAKYVAGEVVAVELQFQNHLLFNIKGRPCWCADNLIFSKNAIQTV
jgi:hypothetical protein